MSAAMPPDIDPLSNPPAIESTIRQEHEVEIRLNIAQADVAWWKRHSDASLPDPLHMYGFTARGCKMIYMKDLRVVVRCDALELTTAGQPVVLRGKTVELDVRPHGDA